MASSMDVESVDLAMVLNLTTFEEQRAALRRLESEASRACAAMKLGTARILELEASNESIREKYQRAVWFLQDIAAMSRKVGSETAAHALAQLGEPRERDGD